MEFIDEAIISVKSGNGGNGALAFRRERNVPLGGPTGGDGGDGGSVYLIADENADTLLPLAKTQTYKAKNGEPGKGNNRHGASAEDIIIRVPVGTVVYKKNNLIIDLAKDGDIWLAARGGKGGIGNSSFATATNQSPTEFTYGEEGESIKLKLELKLIADVGLLGLPNAGKSTLLSRLSAARPKIADYPFTTLKPQLGIVSDGNGHELVMADIPGIIEGAASGAGMGLQFLRHVERCQFLLHVVELMPLDGSKAYDNYVAINEELKKYSEILADKPQIVVANKIDLTGAEKELEELKKMLGKQVIDISAATGHGIKILVQEMFKLKEKYKVSDNIDKNGSKQNADIYKEKNDKIQINMLEKQKKIAKHRQNLDKMRENKQEVNNGDEAENGFEEITPKTEENKKFYKKYAQINKRKLNRYGKPKKRKRI